MSLKAAGVWLCAPRAALPQLMAGRRSGRLQSAAMACGNALTCEAGSFACSHILGSSDAQEGRFRTDTRATLSNIWDVFPLCNLYMWNWR